MKMKVTTGNALMKTKNSHCGSNGDSKPQHCHKIGALGLKKRAQ